MKGALALLLVSTAACGITSDYGGTRFRCDEGRCPSGFECLAGFCEGGEQPGVDGGDTQGDAPMPPGSCVGLDGLQDDFGGETLDLRRWRASPGDAVPGGELDAVLVAGGLLYLGGGRTPDETFPGGVEAIEPRMTTGTLSITFASAAEGGTGNTTRGNVRVGGAGAERGVRIDLSPLTVTVGGQPPEPSDDVGPIYALFATFTDGTVTVRVQAERGGETRTVGTWSLGDAQFPGDAGVVIEAGGGEGDPTAADGALVIDAVGISPGSRITCPPEGG